MPTGSIYKATVPGKKGSLGVIQPDNSSESQITYQGHEDLQEGDLVIYTANKNPAGKPMLTSVKRVEDSETV